MNANELKDKITLENTIELLEYFGAEIGTDNEEYCTFTSICHHSDSKKIYLYKETNTLFCFVCGATDVISLVQECEGLSFNEAMKWLVDFFHLDKPVGKVGRKYYVHEKKEIIKKEVDISERLPSYNESILNTFEYFSIEWLMEDISIEAMKQFEISIDIPLGHSNEAEASRNALLAGIKLFSSAASLGASYYGNLSANSEYAENIYKSGDASKIIDNSYKIRANEELLKYNTLSKSINMASDFTSNLIIGMESNFIGGKGIKGFGKFMNPIDNSDDYISPALVLKMPKVLYNTSTMYSKYAHLVGRPCQIIDTLSNLHGYTEVSGVHLENFSYATTDELEEIESIIKSGILLPDPPNS